MATPLRKAQFQLISFLVQMLITIFSQGSEDFIFNGFQGANLHLDGGASIHTNGLLQLTNFSKKLKTHAFYPIPLKFNKSLSFSTTFAFAIYPEVSVISGEGIVLAITPSMDFTHAVAGQFLGLFNSTNNLPDNHILAIELDTLIAAGFGDINSNHVGIDVNGPHSVASESVMYYSDIEKRNKSLSLTSEKPMQIWIDYDEEKMRIDVAIAPLMQPKPSRPLLSSKVNLSAILLKHMYVGFSSATGTVASNHYVLGWSFSQERKAQSLDFSKLPKLPRTGSKKKINPGYLTIIIITSSLLMLTGGAAYVARKKKYEELVEDWEQAYVFQRYSYKDLHKAMKGFNSTRLLGAGGFGKVYKGVLPSANVVAVKRISHESVKGMKEFVAEIACMSKIRHRHLVQLLGYSRRKKELLLVYEYMPNGSLDKFLFSNEKPTLNWGQRFNIIKGVASAFLYLHEEWEQVILHRDIKAANVLLDVVMDARLGDFGLARLYDHGTNPQTTHVVGTVGYLAPELVTKGKATTRTDVFAFGTFMLEVACGRRPVCQQGFGQQEVLIDWVLECWKKGAVLEANDPRLEGRYSSQEMELVQKLGLLCTHSRPKERPSMRQVMQFLSGDTNLPEILLDSAGTYLYSSSSQKTVPFPTSSSTSASASTSTNVPINTLYSSTDTVLQYGR